MEYSRFRVSSPIKSFRDLEVYQKTIHLSYEMTCLSFLQNSEFEKDKMDIKELSEKIPCLIAESYGDRFDSLETANKKLTKAITLLSDIITKIDLLRERFSEQREHKEILDKLLTNYIYQKTKILNLRKAWNRVFDKRENEGENRGGYSKYANNFNNQGSTWEKN